MFSTVQIPLNEYEELKAKARLLQETTKLTDVVYGLEYQNSYCRYLVLNKDEEVKKLVNKIKELEHCIYLMNEKLKDLEAVNERLKNIRRFGIFLTWNK